MIGIFDSGLGGLSVRKELAKLMPDQNFCYIADSAYCPYGRKFPKELQNRCKKLSNFLIEQRNCDLIVVACNTATAAAIDILRSEYSIPFVGMEPAIKPAILHSKTGTVGVLATAGTFKGALYHRTLTEFQGDVKVIEQVGDGLVELVENDKIESNEAKELLTNYLTPMIKKIFEEKKVLDKITIVNSAPAVALQTQRILQTLKQNNEGLKENKFYSTGNEIILENFVKNIISCFETNTQSNIIKKNIFEHLTIQ